MAANRTVALAVFLSLALGIGISTATFGMVNYVLFQQLPVPDSSQRIASAPGPVRFWPIR